MHAVPDIDGVGGVCEVGVALAPMSRSKRRSRTVGLWESVRSEGPTKGTGYGSRQWRSASPGIELQR